MNKVSILSKSFKTTASVHVQRMFSTYKTSTGLVGLAVDTNGKENLIKATDAVLAAAMVLLNLYES